MFNARRIALSRRSAISRSLNSFPPVGISYRLSFPSTETAEAGCIIVEVRLPWPWPPIKKHTTTIQFSNGKAEFDVGGGGVITLSISINDGTGEKTYSFRSCQIMVPNSASSRLAFKWKLPNEASIWMEGECIFSTDPDNKPRTFYYAGLKSPAFTPEPDFSEKNAQQISKRTGRLSGYERNFQNASSHRTRALKALVDEFKQLNELTKLLSQGSNYHAHGIAARLRLLIAEGEPMPLLQTCAAINNTPLILYCCRYYEFKIDTTVPEEYRPKLVINMPTVRGAKTHEHYIPIDLDVWLNLNAMKIDTKFKTNKNVILDIGNTVGAHFDLQLKDTVGVLQDVEVADYSVRSNFAEYLGSIANSIIPLIERVLTDTGTP